MVVEILSELGYAVSEASNGSQALAMIEKMERPPSLLVTDVVMPEMSGRELGDKLKESFPEMKILFISGYPTSLVQRDGSLSPDLELLSKPFLPSVLAQRVRDVLDGS